MTHADVIRVLDLQPLPGEGGYFRQTWRSPDVAASGALGARYSRETVLGTAIYYLVTDGADGFSALHRLPTDEIYHFYLGDPVEQLLLHPDGHSERVVMGQDLAAGHRVQQVAPRDVWQGTRLVQGGAWALLGTTMAPGFDHTTCEFGTRETLCRQYPERAELITALTRR
jgi:predicted cupin superfamily sugar epimerase